MNACSRTAALWATLSIGTHSKSRELRVTTISTLTRHHSSHDSGLSRAALQHLQKKTKAPPRRSPKHTHQTGTYPHSKSEKKASGLPAHSIHTHTHTTLLLLPITQKYSTLIQFNTTSPSPSRSEYANTNKQIHIHQTGTC